MQKSYLDRLFVICLAGALVGSAPYVKAQDQENAVPQVRILDLELDQPLSPKYQDTTNSAARRENEWLEITLEYETRGGDKGWVDEVAIQWSVVIMSRAGKPLLLKHTETYIDVYQGIHHAVVYVRPNILRRYGGLRGIRTNQVAVYVQLKAGSGKVAEQQFTKTRVPEGWWNSKAPNVIIRDDELFSKVETPFAPLDYEYYEHQRTVRQQR